MRRVEDALLAACPTDVDVVALAPLVPLGAHSAIATVDQNNVVTSIRNTEVAADPTNALALEASVRRGAALKINPKSRDVVRLGASQRVVRAQHVSGPGRFAHFQLFGLVTAGRDDGGYAFEAASVSEHLKIHTRALSRARCGPCDSPSNGSLGAAAPAGSRRRATCAERRGGVLVRRRPEARQWARLLPRLLFQGIRAIRRFRPETSDDDAGGFETSDGGCVDWTQRFLGSAKERCFISGIGIDRVALASAAP